MSNTLNERLTSTKFRIRDAFFGETTAVAGHARAIVDLQPFFMGAVPENGRGTWGIPSRNHRKLPMYANLPGKMSNSQSEHLDFSLIFEKTGGKGRQKC